ncbi:hypothetical protein H6769_02355 [Candidatus Peribacteria bacterium]|nr:hypothetical protein [Candidatus Peribacteria bacterium]
MAYLENPEHENQTPLLWNITDQANAATTDYTKRYPYVWGDRLGIVLDKGSNAPVQQ